MPDNLAYQRSVTKISGQVVIGKTGQGEPICVSLDDLAALEAARTQLEQELAEIRNYLDMLPEGPTDPRGNKAFSARRLKGAAHQIISRRIGELKKEQRRIRHQSVEQRQKSLEQKFIEVARRKLPPETYLEIWNEVNAEQNNHESE